MSTTQRPRLHTASTARATLLSPASLARPLPATAQRERVQSMLRTLRQSPCRGGAVTLGDLCLVIEFQRAAAAHSLAVESQ